MRVLETNRLVLRRMTMNDARFIVELVNEPSFIENIGDKGVRSLENADDYIRNGPMAIALYRPAGYRECGPFGDYKSDPLSIFMEKSLLVGRSGSIQAGNNHRRDRRGRKG